jgi:hypothetical protein
MQKRELWKIMTGASVSISSCFPLLLKLDGIVSLPEWNINTYTVTVKHIQSIENWKVINKAIDGLPEAGIA